MTHLNVSHSILLTPLIDSSRLDPSSVARVVQFWIMLVVYSSSSSSSSSTCGPIWHKPVETIFESASWIQKHPLNCFLFSMSVALVFIHWLKGEMYFVHLFWQSVTINDISGTLIISELDLEFHMLRLWDGWVNQSLQLLIFNSFYSLKFLIVPKDKSWVCLVLIRVSAFLDYRIFSALPKVIEGVSRELNKLLRGCAALILLANHAIRNVLVEAVAHSSFRDLSLINETLTLPSSCWSLILKYYNSPCDSTF